MIEWRKQGELVELTPASGPDYLQVEFAESMKVAEIAPAGCEYWINQIADSDEGERARLEAMLPAVEVEPVADMEPVFTFTPA